MIDTQRMTLSHFFEIDKQHMAQATELAHSPALKEVKAKIAHVVPEFKLPQAFYDKVFEAMLQKLDAVMSIDIPDLLAQSWRKRKELWEYLDREQYPPETSFTVFFQDHDFRSVHHPVLEPIISETINLEKILFDVDVVLNVKGVILEIQDAKIKQANFGLCTGTGTIGYKGVSFLEKENKLLEIGSINWKEGIPISRI